MSPAVQWTASMPGSDDSASRDLAVAAAAAVEGGLAARRWYRSDDLDVHRKGAGDPVTAADHAANDAILERLAVDRPDDRVRSEESPPLAAGTAGAERLWIVDPLDGTKEFIARNGEFAVMVGLAVDGRTVTGAVLRPDPGRLYVGFAAGGAWWADVSWGDQDGNVIVGRFAPLALASASDGRLRMVHSRSHPDPLITEIGRRSGSESVRSGSVGVKCALVAEGSADFYVHPVPFLKEWDTCAPEAVLRGAGGKVSDCAGRELTYGKDAPRQLAGIFAARADVWRSTLPLVREVTSHKLGFAP